MGCSLIARDKMSKVTRWVAGRREEDEGGDRRRRAKGETEVEGEKKHPKRPDTEPNAERKLEIKKRRMERREDEGHGAESREITSGLARLNIRGSMSDV